MIRGLLIFSLVLAVAACSLRDPARKAESNVALPYEAKLSAGDDKRDLEIRVENRGDGLEEVRESVRFQATKYCLLKFGGSDTAWDFDPTTEDWAFTQDGDELIFSARCTVR